MKKDFYSLEYLSVIQLQSIAALGKNSESDVIINQGQPASRFQLSKKKK